MNPTRFAQLRYAEPRWNGGRMPEVVNELGEWLDASKIELFHLCPQKFYWRHELHLVPKPDVSPEVDPSIEWATAPQFGFALHKGLEALYSPGGFDPVTCPCPFGCQFCLIAPLSDIRDTKPIPRFIAQFLLHYPWDPSDDKDVRTRARGVSLLISYVEKWRVDNYQVIAVEVPFSIPFPEFTYIGRIDLVGRWNDSKTLFPQDHKSTTRFGDMFDQQFKLSLQMTGYIHALEQVTNEPVNEGMINALRVTTKIDDDSFKRIVTSRTPDEIVRWKQEVISAWDHIKHYRATGFWPRHAPFACSAYFSRCAYYSLCTSGADSQRDQIANSYERKPWTPIAE